MERLFARLETIYLQRWTAAFGGEGKVEAWETEWSNALESEGITLLNAKYALDVCRAKYKYPPSLPQFISLCRYGGLTEEQLFNIAAIEMEKRRAWKEQNWPSRSLFWAASSLGNDLLCMPYKLLEARWSLALERFCKDIRPIPESDKGHALECKPSSREHARQNIEKMKAMVGAENIPYVKTQPEPKEQMAIAGSVGQLKSFKSIVGICMPTKQEKIA